MTTPLLDLAVGLSRAEVLRFPDRKIVAIPHDPLGHATRAIQDGAHDFMFAISEAFNAKDADGLAEIQGHIAACVEALRVVETMAVDFSQRLR